MAFADLAMRDGMGVVYRLDLSTDGFATVSHRYGTVAGKLDGANDYEARLSLPGALSRAFGNDHIAAAASVDIALDNTDGAVDWLVHRADAPAVLTTRARLHIGLYDPRSPGAIESKQLGEYVFVGFPRRDGASVRGTLADDMLGALEQAAPTPSLLDWASAAGATHDNTPMVVPLHPTYGVPFGSFEYALNSAQQIPLAFGATPVDVALIGRRTTPISGVSTLDGRVGYVVCAGLEPLSDVMVLYSVGSDGVERAVPKSHTYDRYLGPTLVWQAHDFGPIAKDGRDWHIHWISVHEVAFSAWFDSVRMLLVGPGLTVSQGYEHTGFRVIARPLSSVWNTSTFQQHAIEVLLDLLGEYAARPVPYEESRLLDAMDAVPVMQVAGTTGALVDKKEAAPHRSGLREHITDICQTSDLDLYVTWAGEAAVYTPALANESGAFVEFEETDLAAFEDWIPGEGERGSPHNRVWLEGAARGRPNPEGPFDNAAAMLAWGGRVLERRLRREWADHALDGRDPWTFRRVESVIRPRCRFNTDLRALQLDLGDLFRLTWTRGHGGPYARDLFQVEALTVHLSACTVTVEAIWRGDINTAGLPFLLHAEASLIRAEGDSSRTISLVHESPVVTFSSGDLLADGVQAGDHLVLTKSQKYESLYWKTNRAIRILSVAGATQLTLTGDLDFGSDLVTGSWQIRKSQLTSGAPAFGGVSVSVASGQYTDATPAHRLEEG